MTIYEQIKNESIEEMALTIGMLMATAVENPIRGDFNRFATLRERFELWAKEYLAQDDQKTERVE